MYYRSGTGARLLTGWQHFLAWNDAMAAILKVWRHIENPIKSVDEHLREE